MSKMTGGSIFKAYPLMREKVEALCSAGILDASQRDLLSAVSDGKIFSLRVETRLMISIGCALMAFAVGLMVRRAGVDWRLLTTVVLALIGFSLVSVAARKIGGFCRGQREAVPIAQTSMLNVGALFLVGFVNLLHFEYAWALVVFLFFGLFFLFLASYCDSRVILAHGVVLVGAYVGVELVPNNWNAFTVNIARWVGGGYGASLVLLAWFLKQADLKPHFGVSLLDMGLPVVLVAGLAGQFRDYSDEYFLPNVVAFLVTLLFGLGAGWVGHRTQSLRYQFMALLVVEVGVVTLIAAAADAPDSVVPEELAMLLISGSCLLTMLAAWALTRVWKRKRKQVDEEAVQDDEKRPKLASMREADAALYLYDATAQWLKSNAISEEQARRIEATVGDRPYEMHTGLRTLLAFVGFVAVWAFAFALIAAVEIEGVHSGILGTVALLAGGAALGLSRSGHYRTGLDSAGWLVLITAGMGAVAAALDSTDYERQASDWVLGVGCVLALGPMVMFAHSLSAVVLWANASLLVLSNSSNSNAFVAIHIVVICLVGLIRRQVRWRQRSRQLVLLQGLSLVALYLALGPNLLTLFHVETTEEWVRFFRSETWFATLSAIVLPLLLISIGVRSRARLPLDIGIATIALSLMHLPQIHGLCTESVSFLIGGGVLCGAGFGLRHFLVAGRVVDRSGFTYQSAMASVDEAWTSQRLEATTDSLKDWVTGLYAKGSQTKSKGEEKSLEREEVKRGN